MEMSIIDKLMELKQLYEQGILTKEEMEVEKAKILKTSTCEVDSPNNVIQPVEDAKSAFASTSNEENHRRKNKVRIGIIAVIVMAIVAVIVYFLNKQTEPTEAITNGFELIKIENDDNPSEVEPDIEDTESSTSMTINVKNKFKDLLKNCKWIMHDGGFQYPDFFEHYEKFLIDIPASVDVYTYDSVDLCFWGGLGAWSVADEFPSEGIYLSPYETVKNITYQSKGIASGYTNSGKIYYLKQKIYGEDVVHSNVLVLIYPPEYDKSVEKLTNMIISAPLKRDEL